MRKAVGVICSLALVLPGAGGVSLAQDRAASQSKPSGQGYCRLPAALPELGPEVEAQQGGFDRSGRTGALRGSATALMESATDAAPPPSPPPPPVASPPPPSVSSPAVTASAPPSASADEAVPVEGAGDAVVVTGAMRSSEPDRAMSSLRRPMPRPIPRPIPPRPQPRPQSGLLTAGEHDDLLNPELYANYISNSNVGQVVRDLPRVDTNRLLTVEVRDQNGQPMPFAQVELKCSDGNTLKLKTVADGRAVFFPEHDRLSPKVKVRVEDGAWRELTISKEPGGQKLEIVRGAPAAQVKKLDLALVVDVTGSMSDELRYLQAELASIVNDLKDRHANIDIRVGFTFYRDKGDAFVTRTFGMTGDIPAAQKNLGAQRASGGGDYPEAMQTALIRAAGQDWRDDAVKTLLLVADAPPHNADIPMTWRAAEHLRNERVHIVPVGASGVADIAEYVMRAMAAVTQSRYTFLTEDSGIGNPKAPPAIDCYLVTRLDQLLRRVIDSQISGRRIEPDKSEVIRRVGKYDAGRCVLPPDFGKQSQS